MWRSLPTRHFRNRRRVEGFRWPATVFEYRSGQPAGDGIEVFRVQSGARTALKRLGRIPMPHGMHHVAIGD
ncbi:hypothetical protein [Pseudoxanthomonas wuyuanensis]